MVKVYSSDSCVWCQRMKSYLESKNVEFEELNVSIQENAQEVYRLSGQNGIPVTVIGNSIIVGFDREAVDQALENE